MHATSLTLCHKSAVPQACCVQCHLPRGRIIPACNTGMQASSMSRQQRHSIKVVARPRLLCMALPRNLCSTSQAPRRHVWGMPRAPLRHFQGTFGAPLGHLHGFVDAAIRHPPCTLEARPKTYHTSCAALRLRGTNRLLGNSWGKASV